MEKDSNEPLGHFVPPGCKLVWAGYDPENDLVIYKPVRADGTPPPKEKGEKLPWAK